MIGPATLLKTVVVDAVDEGVVEPLPHDVGAEDERMAELVLDADCEMDRPMEACVTDRRYCPLFRAVDISKGIVAVLRIDCLSEIVTNLGQDGQQLGRRKHGGLLPEIQRLTIPENIGARNGQTSCAERREEPSLLTEIDGVRAACWIEEPSGAAAALLSCPPMSRSTQSRRSVQSWYAVALVTSGRVLREAEAGAAASSGHGSAHSVRTTIQHRHSTSVTIPLATCRRHTVGTDRGCDAVENRARALFRGRRYLEALKWELEYIADGGE